MDKKQEFIIKDQILTPIIAELFIWLQQNDFSNVGLSGGTVLSKSYKLIKRLSQDIDLVIFVSQNNSNSRCKRIKKEIDKYFSNKYKITDCKYDTFTKESNFSNFRFIYRDQEFAVDIICSKQIEDNPLSCGPLVNVLDDVKELGKIVRIDLYNILCNKLIAFHKKYHSQKSDDVRRIVRHVYDISKIITYLGANGLKEALSKYPEYVKIDNDGVSEDILKNKGMFNKSVVDVKKSIYLNS